MGFSFHPIFLITFFVSQKRKNQFSSVYKQNQISFQFKEKMPSKKKRENNFVFSQSADPVRVLSPGMWRMTSFS